MASSIFERRLNLKVEELWPILTDFTNAPTPDVEVEVSKNRRSECRWSRHGESNDHQQG